MSFLKYFIHPSHTLSKYGGMIHAGNNSRNLGTQIYSEVNRFTTGWVRFYPFLSKRVQGVQLIWGKNICTPCTMEQITYHHVNTVSKIFSPCQGKMSWSERIPTQPRRPAWSWYCWWWGWRWLGRRGWGTWVHTSPHSHPPYQWGWRIWAETAWME